MKRYWARLHLASKILALTIPVLLVGMGGLTSWLADGMHSDLQSRLRDRGIVIQKQIEVTRGYLASQYVAKIKGAGQGVMKVGQDHSAPDTVPLPATATREMSEQLSQLGIYTARVISQRPLNPANSPQGPFEEEALRALEAGAAESIRVEPVNGVLMFRRMTPDIITSQACIGCHADRKMGEMVGAVSVQIPMEKPLSGVEHKVAVLYAVGALGAVGLAAILFLLLRHLVILPLKDLDEAVEKIGQGHYATRAMVATEDEIGQLAQAFNNMGENLQAASTKQQEMATAAQEAAAEIQGVTSAIGKAQAVIEFNLDGTVITANDNFLNCLGYRLPDIQGKHHRMFCEPAYSGSPAYSAFWQKLNRGEFDAGVYKRIGKGGTDVWIQASYNPIVDVNGKPYKVMEFSMDITAQRNQAAEFEGKINAINKAQAAIEFNLDGTVITANENFLGCLGYQIHEIKGQHHRLFCDQAYTKSSEYVTFWQKLNRGEFDAGACKRIGKGGKEIWIQASYNPIVDANGKVYKVVEYATDITAQKKAQLEQEQLVGEAQQVLGALADGDLTQPMVGTYQGELEQLKGSVNRALANLTTALTTVRTAAESVSTGAEQITKGNEDLSQRTSEQASSLEETSSAMEEMTSTVKQNADNAKQANQLAIAAHDVAEKGGAVTTKAIDAMEEINKSSKKIADIITVIDEIAFQTNLLALNAAVEAARAGEHGRGFAVVAAEVRNLAQRSATAAKEIKGLINESVQRVTDGSELVDQSGKTLTEIVSSVKRVTDIIAEISAASQEQASGIDQVNKAIMQMDETTQQNAALVEEATSASQSMKEQAKELMTQVASFKMNGTSDASGSAVKQASRETHHAAPKPAAKKSAPAPEPDAVATGKSRSKDGEFEEF